MRQAELDLLVLAFQQGEKTALTALYQHFQRDLLRFAQWQLRGQPVAADLVQNVWLKVMQRVGRLQDPAVFTSWLYRAVRWEILDWQKHADQRFTDRLAEPEMVQTPVQPEDDLAEYLVMFDAEDQLLVRLFYQLELAQQDIALILQLPAGTVKSRLFRIRKQLATQIRPETDHGQSAGTLE
ncbi:MAG: sigma-70 family RNA polymerase sigma factor [Rheinheimera sp.]|nr:sigma-70 family RNA polymerase sigma factor [Rheinheimera sp.]